jgi:hypothetical protein
VRPWRHPWTKSNIWLLRACPAPTGMAVVKVGNTHFHVTRRAFRAHAYPGRRKAAKTVALEEPNPIMLFTVHRIFFRDRPNPPILLLFAHPFPKNPHPARCKSLMVAIVHRPVARRAQGNGYVFPVQHFRKM